MFRVTFICLLLLFFYSALFYSSANTPLAEASFSEWLDVLSLSLMCAAAVALVVQLVFWVLAKVYGPIAAAAPVVEKGIALTIMFCLALLILENWFYSLFSLGLKSGESTLYKLLFLSGALFLAIQSVSGILFLTRVLKPFVYGAVIAVVSLFWVAGGLSALIQDTGSPATQLISHSDNPINILLIASDGLNADALSVYGNSSPTTPFLDSVASEFMIFDNAYSNSGTTTGGVTAMLTGQSPLVTRVVYPPDILEDEFSSQSLPALLSRDHYLRVQWSVPHYASANEQNLIGAFDSINGKAIDRLDDMSIKAGLSSIQIWFLSRLSDDQAGVVMDALFIEEMQNPYLQVAEGLKTEGKTLSDTQRLNGLLDDLDISLASDRALFAQVHFMDSHGPVFNPPHREFSKGLVQTKKWMEPFYFDSVLDFDAKLATIYHKLSAKGQLDNTVLVVTSDHGQRHSMERRIPLLIRFPGGEMAGRYRGNVQLTDIAPTLLEYLAIPKPQWMRGLSLLDAGEIPPDRLILSATSGKRGPNEDGKWVRLETGNFQDSNKFQVIYCDRFVNVNFPDPRPSVKQLPGNTSPNDCMNTAAGELANLAIATLKLHFEN